MYQLHNLSFKTKKETKEYYKDLLNYHRPEERLRPEYEKQVLALLPHHPRRDEIDKENIIKVVVLRVSPYYTHSFCLILKDGSHYPFSYIKSIKNLQ